MKNTKDINNKNYDLLWKWGVPYLFMSIYLESGYTKVDTISYNENDTNYLFIAKKSRQKLSKDSFILYTSKFDKFTEKLQDSQQKVIKYLRREKIIEVLKLNNKQLLNRFIIMAKYLKGAWTVYFPTEVHSFDLVADKIADNTYLGQNKLIKNVRIISALRQRQRDVINQIIYSPGPFDKYSKEISRRFNKDINHLSYKEVMLLLRGKKVSRRKQKFVIVGKSSNWEDIIGSKAQILFKQLLPFDNNVKELKGTIANKGYYKGRVRKIDFSLRTDFQKAIINMQKGEVLISGSTGPEMILACKKAGAIVTEEGGTLSHAAIVSRELGIPCIIGTKIATKVFKTGDLIEVDANKGVVKICKRASS